jgi:hypothetical protein
MSRFKEILKSEGFDVEKGERSEGTNVGLKTNFGTVLGAIFSDILEKKSSVYRDMIAKGINMDLSQGFNFPESMSGSMPELVKLYEEDMK